MVPVCQICAQMTAPHVVEQPAQVAGGFSDRSFGLCAQTGDCIVAVIAVDPTGNVPLPVSADVSRPSRL